MSAQQGKKVVLITGGNAGLGFHTCLNIVKSGNYHLILTGRSSERVQQAAERVRAQAHESTTVEEAVLDLASLSAIREFCNKFKSRDDVKVISTLVCNAGLTSKTKQLTVDGYEMTFAVNHLGHFLLVNELHPITERVLIVSSETHDPEERTLLPPKMTDLEQLAHGYQPFMREQAYSTSKLCNLLMMFEFMRQLPNGPRWLAYTPGFTPDTGLDGRSESEIDAIYEHCRMRRITLSTSDVAGVFMARLVTEDWAANGWNNGDYIRVTKAHKPSKQAHDLGLAKDLWDKSEELVVRALGA